MIKDNIVLIGMPGSGKSTIGVVLAKVMGYDFIDSDLLIQAKEGRLLKDIIKEDGLDAFLAIENKVNASIKVHNSVIATGGSAIYGKEAMERLTNMGTVIYLRLSYENIVNRLGDLAQRGVAMKEGQTLLDLYKERIPLYERYAHITMDGEDYQIREMVERIKEKIRQ